MEPLPASLLAHLIPVPDYRKARGQRFTWTYLLALVATAVAAGQTTAVAMVSWANTHAQELFSTLQPTCPRIPALSTWRRLVSQLDIAALEQQVAAYNQTLAQTDPAVGRVTMRNGEVWHG